ncbi:PAS domain S-box-containing protein [Pseudorhizobium tarimense]|uniref:PAS domain S-box-containing protein n=1 Tax=Pseudorhizobium tarimense TaxID=1079109 RepID=A0ABV2H0M7_9HYPH|nr:PAS domain S-box protein [Pseudorhizobium tarimense]MCJ8517423.1 PAS domain S-box protein [Pseudorhizobium tarimense]
MSEHSSETYSIRSGAPVITQDISKEDRFKIPHFMKDAGVVALANVPIFVPGREPYGHLQVDSQEPRRFDDVDTQFLRTYATILGPVIDRLQKLEALKASEERFGLIVENARDYAIFVSDANDRIIDWHKGAEVVCGWTAEEADGMCASKLFTKEDRAHGEDRNEMRTAIEKGKAPNVRWHLRKDGSLVFIEGSVTYLHGRAFSAFQRPGEDYARGGPRVAAAFAGHPDLRAGAARACHQCRQIRRPVGA